MLFDYALSPREMIQDARWASDKTLGFCKTHPKNSNGYPVLKPHPVPTPQTA